MPFMVDEESLVKPDDTLVQNAGFLRSVIEQARRSHAQPLISVPRRSAQSGAPETLATVTLPVELVNFIFVVVDNLAKGRAIALLTFNPLLTTHQAARVLGVSRPYLTKLLKNGEMEFSMVGSHRRVHLEEVLRYKGKRDVGRRQTLDELTKISQEAEMDYMGEGFEPTFIPKTKKN
jgi:excisionase family DNA binding protein